MGRLDGKVALISGGARGIGGAQAALFAREGAKVVIGDLLEEEGKKKEREIRQAGGDAAFVHQDVTKEADWRRAIKTALDLFGRLDVLVNNAGIVILKSIEETTEEEWDRTMAVNAKGVFLGTKHVIPVMRHGGGGSIVNISSIAGLIGRPLGSAAYGASKGTVRLFTKQTAVQHAKDNIRCNSIHPGPIQTAMLDASFDRPGAREGMMKPVPLSRVGTVEDIAYGALYLASDESSYVTGCELVIDGGITAQ